MIIGGVSAGWTGDIELVSPYGNTIPDCLSNLSPFTKGHIHGSAGAALASGTYDGGIRVSFLASFQLKSRFMIFLPTEQRFRIPRIFHVAVSYN